MGVSQYLGTGSMISMGFYGNTKITFRDQVFTTIIGDFELTQSKDTVCPEVVKSLLCLIFQNTFTMYSQLTVATYLYLR